ncbi:hypothetical protein SAMN05421882_101413 [Nitrosomonas communis]|uniref:Uncharacterized protein n=1 Tax=Nitrosomonas communis TaxID=44574 RepID=A0A1H2U2W3_9PROT|nr:hypothetical protein SAMN05421882_101413 [Nitrosomonas communis]
MKTQPTNTYFASNRLNVVSFMRRYNFYFEEFDVSKVMRSFVPYEAG